MDPNAWGANCTGPVAKAPRGAVVTHENLCYVDLLLLLLLGSAAREFDPKRDRRTLNPDVERGENGHVSGAGGQQNAAVRQPTPGPSPKRGQPLCRIGAEWHLLDAETVEDRGGLGQAAGLRWGNQDLSERDRAGPQPRPGARQGSQQVVGPFVVSVLRVEMPDQDVGVDDS